MSAPKKLAQIPWSANEGALTWTLLGHLQAKENFIVLFGKEDPKENTSGDSKSTVYARIAKAMFPQDFVDHATTLGKRVKGKTEELCKTYKDKAARLRVTGGGVGAPEDAAPSGGHEYLDYYIPGDGPHHDTPAAAVNLWQQLNEEFPYFSELHKFLSTRPNVVPPLITTGIGPNGRRIVHNQTLDTPAPQQFDYSLIDPALLQPPSPTVSAPVNTRNAAALLESRPISTNNRIQALQTPQMGPNPGSAAPKSTRGPKPSTFGTDLSNTVDKARQSVQHIPRKPSTLDIE